MMENPLKKKRKELGISKEEMSKRLSTTIYNITEWELSRRIPKSHMLIDISEAYNLSNEELIEYLKYLNEIRKE